MGPTINPREEMLDKRVEDLSLRGDTFLKQIEKLTADSKRREHDTTDMINSLETDVKNRDVNNKDLAKQLKELTLQQVADKRGMKSHFEKTLQEAEAVFLAKEAKLLNANRQLMQEVSDLTEFKKMRHQLEQELARTNETIEINEEKHLQQLKELERKFYEARERLEKEADDRIAQSRQLYKEEVGKELDMDSKRIRKENKLMEAELKFQRDTSERLHKENTVLRERAKKLREELVAKSANDEAKAHHGLKNTKTVAELSEKLKKLGEMIQKIQSEAQRERETVAKTQTKKEGILSKKLNNIKQTYKVKNREMTAIQHNARTILTQRNEIEQFFLESLELVKDEVRRRRESSYKEAVDLYNRFLKDMTHPQSLKQEINDIKSLGPAPRPPKRGVTLDDLDKADKERVLELLLERILTNPRACERMGPPFSEFVRAPQPNLAPVYTDQSDFGGTGTSLGAPPETGQTGDSSMYLTYSSEELSQAPRSADPFFITEGENNYTPY